MQLYQNEIILDTSRNPLKEPPNLLGVLEEEIAKSGILNGILIIERNTTKSSIKTFLLKRNSADSGYLEIGTQYICPVVDGKIRILNRDEDTSISFQTFGIKYQIIFSVQIISIS
ncbi:hypothetical protein [Listeria ivanovii]|uniref:Uncharacterized protein n=2 Tax=Listeria ivanovii TaxID=1638 RepID=A0ABS1G3A9_LISIV|nr:hypothetical protein [Listeria ivanovii]AIS60271.1 hypothetical protein JL58_09935 [Listeria ivanovii subsp. londoniensis]MBK1961363.1 hypothetical protein [Listeria ivanovii subsp. londoniensis]MBM5608346.1 hypothetical protein [Listeria ivanovii]MBM5636389.1 hypothetical protein [Listeria ivanovii]MBM5705761.1 hypothetical protein [Listeria ivanovii]